MKNAQKPQLTFGAVYYRRSNPPRIDWERDYAKAAEDGMNSFRHWFLWSALEVAPGKFNFEPYDRQMELAEKNGISTVIAEMQTIPEWLYHQRPDLIGISANGERAINGMGPSTVAGGFVEGWLCLDHEDAREYAANFLHELASHYKGHPALYGYDIMNECNYSRRVCYCEATQQRFREWLKEKYGTLEALGEAWRRYSFSDWSQVSAPRYSAQFPDCMDWMEFNKIRCYDNLQWRIDRIREVDPDCRILAHGLVGSLDTINRGSDDWLAATKVETYGFTWVACRQGNEKWKHWHAVDLTRSASRGKEFWHAEMQGGPLWLQPQVIGRRKEDGRVATAEDVRLWSMVTLAGGSRGLIWTRWRALLDGPLFGAFGLYNNDGTPNGRSDMASAIGKWGNSPKTAALMASAPVHGDIGIIVLDDVQEFSSLMQQAGEGKFYTRCMRGAYRAFHDQNIQADWVHFDDIDSYKLLYFPYPIHMKQEQSNLLMKWVENGGKLICEGTPAYFGDLGHVDPIQPGNGLFEMFGAKESDVEFMPDLGDEIFFSFEDIENIPGGLFLQSYETADANGGEIVGRYDDGRSAAVQASFGKGSVILLGTFPSEAYNRCESPKVSELFARLMAKMGAAQMAKVDNAEVAVRISKNEQGQHFLWAVNHGYSAAKVSIELQKPFGAGEILWGNETVAVSCGKLNLTVPAQDAVIFELK